MVAAHPVLVCHRGASALAPENSLEAFRVAMQYGVDFSELDVHLGRGGDLLVTHDAPVDEGTLARLTEVFNLVRGGGMGLYVELKGDHTGRALADLVHGGAAIDFPLIAGSFRLELVAELQHAAPELTRSILFAKGSDLDAIIGACRERQARYAHPCFRPVTAELVDGLHAAGLLVMTPHTNEPAEARHFVNVGVDVIASDNPRILLPLRG